MANSSENNHNNTPDLNSSTSSLQSAPMLVYSDPEDPITWEDANSLNSSIGASSTSSSCFFSTLSHNSTLPSASTPDPTPSLKLPDEHLNHQPHHTRFTNWLANSKLLAEPVQTGQEQAHQTHHIQPSPTWSTFSSAPSSPEFPLHLPKISIPSNWPLPPSSPSSPFASRSFCGSPTHSERPQRLHSPTLCPNTRKLTLSLPPRIFPSRQQTTPPRNSPQPCLPLPFTATISNPMPAIGSLRSNTQQALQSAPQLPANPRRVTTASSPKPRAIPAIMVMHRQSAYSLTSEMTEETAFEDAREQAEWMDIDDGDAYEDLARTEDLVRAASVRLSAIHRTPDRRIAATGKRPYTGHKWPIIPSHQEPRQFSPEHLPGLTGLANLEISAPAEEHRHPRPSSAVALFTRAGVWDDNSPRSDSRTDDSEPVSTSAEGASRGWRRKPLILRPAPPSSSRSHERFSILPPSSVTSCSNTSSDDHPRPRPFTPPDLLSRYTAKPSYDWLDEQCLSTAPVPTKFPETVYEDEQDEANELQTHNLRQKRVSVGMGRWSVVSSTSVKAFDERELDRVGLAVFLEGAAAKEVSGKERCQLAPRAMRGLRCGSQGVRAGEQARFSVVRPDEPSSQPLEPTEDDTQPPATLPIPQHPRESLISSMAETLAHRPRLVSLYKSVGEADGAALPDPVRQRKTSFGLRQNITAAATRVRKTSMPALIRRRSAMTGPSSPVQRSSALGSLHKPGPTGVSGTLMRLRELDCKLVDLQPGRNQQQWIEEERSQKKIGGKLRVISRPALLTDQDERHVLWQMIRRAK